MEDDPFNKSKNETDSDDDSESGSSSKKKKKSRRFPLFTVNSEKTETAQSENKSEESVESLWKRMIGQAPIEQAADEKAETSAEKSKEGVESDNPEQLGVLSEHEQAAIVEAYIVARQAELVDEQANAFESGDETLVAERVADIAFLDRVKNLLESNRDQSIAEPLQQAYDDTARRLAFESAVSSADSEIAPDTAENSSEDSYVEEQIFVRQQAKTPNTVFGWGDAESATVTPANPNVVPHSYPNLGPNVAPNNRPETVAEYQEPNRTGTSLLVGGALGYLLGRRHGRIKTEKQMKIVEKKLKHEVEIVEQRIVQKEQQIRSLARETYIRKRTVLTPEKAAPLPIRRNERIGLVTMKAAETRFAPETTVAPEKVKIGNQPEKQPEFMSRVELLEVGAAISVGATNLARVYETNLITEQGLRHLIYEHEHGGNVQASLQRELIEKEMSYERDPRLRNRSIMGALAASSSVVRADIDKHSSANSEAEKIEKNQISAASKQKAITKKSPTNNQVATTYVTITTLVVVIAILLYVLFTGK